MRGKTCRYRSIRGRCDGSDRLVTDLLLVRAQKLYGGVGVGTCYCLKWKLRPTRARVKPMFTTITTSSLKAMRGDALICEAGAVRSMPRTKSSLQRSSRPTMQRLHQVKLAVHPLTRAKEERSQTREPVQTDPEPECFFTWPNSPR